MNTRSQAIAAHNSEIDASTQRAVAARLENEKPRRMSALESMAMRCRVNEKELTAALTSTVFKECKSQAQFLALVVVANEYGLNPLTKEIYAFPVKGGSGVVPMVSVDGWISLMNRHPDFDGIEFDYHEDDKGNLIAVESIIHHKNRSKPIKTVEFMSECRGNTGPWQKSPRRMLRHRALIQGARIAFGFSAIYAPDEVDMIDAEYTVSGENNPAILPSASDFESSAPSYSRGEAEDRENAEELGIDYETGEVIQTNPTTGMTEVDEETARALDAGEEVEPDEQQEDDQPAWTTAVAGVRALINGAKNRAAWKRADDEFQKIAAGLPDEVAADLDRALTAKSKEIAAGA